uniref:Uncharacterized protein n=1 Tax=Arundo donax TaxID=35708 RepID=A0A0A8ZTP6_ARUDO
MSYKLAAMLEILFHFYENLVTRCAN